MRARPGVNLIEVLMASSVAGIVLLALGGFMLSSMRAGANDQDRAFANQKVLQLMEEVSASKPKGKDDGGLEKFADGAQFLLTTQTAASPSDPISGNPRPNGWYKYVRRITTDPVAGDDYARRVTVELFYAARDARPTIPPDAKPLAVVANILRGNNAKVGPRQVIDVYAISLENVAHGFRKDEDHQYFPAATDVRRLFDAALRGLEAKNPWLEYRVHLITRGSIGRDPRYTPALNERQALTGNARDPLDAVYFYPGRLVGTADGPRYFDANAINARIAVDGEVRGRYAACDQFNHAVRYPLEFEASGKARMPVVEAGATKPEPSLRQLLEAMLTDTEGRFRNAIVVNLHGDILPALPLRNYADAAQDPANPDANAARRRLVGHPYRLAFDPTQGPVRVLVHPFMADGRDTPAASGNDRHVALASGFPASARRARVVVRGVKPFLADGGVVAPGTIDADDLTVRVVQRERTSSGSCSHCDDATYVAKVAWPEAAATIALPGRKDHSGPAVDAPTFDGDDLVVPLGDLDYDAHDTGTHGIEAGRALHGLQYMPDPFLPFLDLPNPDHKPRNTARAILEFNLKPSSVGRRIEVVTQLMRADGTYAASDNDPTVSRSWFYTVDAGDWDAARRLYWRAGTDQPAIPWTDQLQLVGDPRHNPYLDARASGQTNPYFAALAAGKAVYPDLTCTGTDPRDYMDGINPFAGLDPTLGTAFDIGFPGSDSSWAGVKYNAPAYFRVWQQALLRNDAIFVNLAGQPMRFLALGGEFDLHGQVNDGADLHVTKKPYDGSTGAADDAADELHGDRGPWIERSGGDRWHALPWLGELYPPDMGAAWLDVGNLPTAAFRRRPLADLAKRPAEVAGHDGREIAEGVGLASWLGAKAGTGLPGAPAGRGDATLGATGERTATSLRQQLMPRLAAAHHVALANGAMPPEWGRTPYNRQHLLGWLEKGPTGPGYYDQGSGHASAGMLVSEVGGDHRAIAVLDTFKPESPLHLIAIMDVAATALTSAYFDGANPALGEDNIKVLPRVRLREPETGQTIRSASVALRWFAKPGRASGAPVSPFFAIPAGLGPDGGGPLDVVYNVKYRNLTANGPWHIAQTTSGPTTEPATVLAGVPAGNAIPNSPAYPAPVTATWQLAGLEPGQYLLRVEAFRTANGHVLPLHLAYHEIPVTIQK